jgi:hypothetical protein
MPRRVSADYTPARVESDLVRCSRGQVKATPDEPRPERDLAGGELPQGHRCRSDPAERAQRGATGLSAWPSLHGDIFAVHSHGDRIAVQLHTARAGLTAPRQPDILNMGVFRTCSGFSCSVAGGGHVIAWLAFRLGEVRRKGGRAGRVRA